MHTLFHVVGFIDNEGRIGVAEGVEDVVAQVVADPAGS
jgi:hypothetical protein